MTNRVWTTQECERLREMVLLGMSHQEIAEKLDRPRATVTARVHILQIKRPDIEKRAGLPWTRAEIATLHILAERGYTPEEIAEKLERTASAVKQKLLRTSELRHNNESLCWRCQNSVPDLKGRGCSWSKKFIPVDGWVAERCVMKRGSTYKGTTESYLVRKCPEFKKDEPRKKKKAYGY